MTDRAVEAIQAPFAPDIRAFFYGERSGLDVNEVSSFAFRAPLATVLEAKEVAYRRHSQPPGWWGGLRAGRRDWVGDELELDARMENALAGEPQFQTGDLSRWSNY